MRKDVQVIERILRRKSKLKDNYKIGLIIQGGGMRGAFSGGSMIGLQKMGVSSLFDTIYASSSGSCAAAYLLANQARRGTAIYWENLSGFNFIKPWKFGKFMDLDYLCDEVFVKEKKLNIQKIKNSDTVLKIYVTNCDNGRCEFISSKEDVDLVKAIKASCSFPIYYNKPVILNDVRYLDGNLGKPIPIEEALTDGCTDLLIITTVPESYTEFEEGLVFGLLKNVWSLSFDKRLRETLKKRRKVYSDSLDVAFGRKKIHRKVNIYTIAPDAFLSKAETNKSRLRQAARAGEFKVEEAFLTEIL